MTVELYCGRSRSQRRQKGPPWFSKGTSGLGKGKRDRPSFKAVSGQREDVAVLVAQLAITLGKRRILHAYGRRGVSPGTDKLRSLFVTRSIPARGKQSQRTPWFSGTAEDPGRSTSAGVFS